MSLLSDLAVRRAKVQEKEYTLKDGDGLFLNIHPNGSKYWLFRFSWQGKQTRISFGTYPSLGLKEAREMRIEARKFLAQGEYPKNPNESLDSEKNQLTFDEFALNWLTFKLKKINAKPANEKKNKGRNSTEVQIRRAFKNDIFPIIGNTPLRLVSRKDLLTIQQNIEQRGSLSIAEKTRSWLNEIFRYAVVREEIETNPATDLDIAAIPYRRNKHNPYLKKEEMTELLSCLHHFKGERQTALGIRLLLLTGVRTGELRFSEPSQFDLKEAVWRIPPDDVKQLQKVKNNIDANLPDYVVPLSRQAIKIVRELLAQNQGERYLLSHRSDPNEAISENTLNQCLHRHGFKSRLTGHGIRGTIATALNELGYEKNWVEAQLSHANGDPYNHAKYLEHRRKMMQDWADMIDKWEEESVNS